MKVPVEAFKVREQRGVANVRVWEVFTNVAQGAHCATGMPARIKAAKKMRWARIINLSKEVSSPS
jgi:hypothetical protein